MPDDPHQPQPARPAVENQADVGPPATQRQKIGLMICLGVITLIFLALGAQGVNHVDRTTHTVVSVAWKKPPEVSLNPGPASFRYDAKDGLIYEGEIDLERKKELRGLFEFNKLRSQAAANNGANTNGARANAAGQSLRDNQDKRPVGQAANAVNNGADSNGARADTAEKSPSADNENEKPVGQAANAVNNSADSNGARADTAEKSPSADNENEKPVGQAANAVNNSADSNGARADTGGELPPGDNERADGGTPASESASREAYYVAIDKLAFLANEKAVPSPLWLLWLGSIAGVLGAVLRSLVDFVGTASYKTNFNLLRWWPLHATRPFVAAILGAFVIVLFRARLITSTNAPTISGLWESLGVAFLAGFSTMDVTMRLKITAKALFGIEKSE